MERVEIVAGIKSALSRGYSIDLAKRSFVNAGYSERDVEDSAASLNNGAISLGTSPLPAIEEDKTEQSVKTGQKYPPLPTIASQIKQKKADYYSEYPSESQKVVSNKKEIFVVILLIVLFLMVFGVLLLLVFSRDTLDAILSKMGIDAILNKWFFLGLFSIVSKRHKNYS